MIKSSQSKNEMGQKHLVDSPCNVWDAKSKDSSGAQTNLYSWGKQIHDVQKDAQKIYTKLYN